MLKNVVFPAPFGPIRLTMRRSGITKSTSWTAISPPNTFRTPSEVRIAFVAVGSRGSSLVTGRSREGVVVLDVVLRFVVHPLFKFGLAARLREEALRAEEHHDEQDDPEDQER